MLSKLKDDEITFSEVKKGLDSYFRSVSELEKFGDVSKLLEYGENLKRISSELENDFKEVS